MNVHSIVGVVATAVASLAVTLAFAATLFDVGGHKVVVITADELIKLMADKDREIMALRSMLDGKTKIECNLI